MNFNKVRLVNSTDRTEKVLFKAQPIVSESGGVEWATRRVLHSPGAIAVFVSTSSRQYSLSEVKLISRNREEATSNLEALNLLRSWRMPAFGKVSTNKSRQTGLSRRNSAVSKPKTLGAPPPTLLLSAYSPDSSTYTADTMTPGNIRKIPVVVESLSITYPNTVDYIPTLDGTPFPTVMTLEVTLRETHSPNELSNFDIHKYKNGILEGF